MQKVAAYALFASFGSVDDAKLRFGAVGDVVKDWLSGKGEFRPAEEGQALVLRDGRVAQFETSSFITEEGCVNDWVLIEPSNNALVRTRISSSVAASKVCVYIELQAAGGAYQLGPMRVDIRCPTIVRSLVQVYGDWFVGDVPISGGPYKFDGESGARELETVIWHPNRNLPVVVVSSYESKYLTETFPADLASELVGVAIVATVDADASWALTTRRGKEWSCFNGAVRIYWPFSARSERPEHNPLWLRDSLLSQAGNPQDAAARFRRQMRRQLLGISAYAVPEPAVMEKIRASYLKTIADEERAALRDSSDWEGLAKSYAEANDKLTVEAQELRDRVRALEADLSNLQVALQWRPDEPPDIAPESEIPPATVEEAVNIAKERYSSTLVFGADVGTGVAALAPSAGPPEKVLSYLGHLSEMTTLRRGTGLGTAPIKWLEARGVDCSGESQTIRNSASEQRKRTWNDGKAPRIFEQHLKPTEATHPDRCVRIYFDYDENTQRCVVGWVGRHP